MSSGYKALAALVLVAALIAAYAGWSHHVYQKGWDARDVIAKLDEQKQSAEAARQLAEKNEYIRAKQIEIDQIVQQIADKQKELSDAKAVSSALQSDLLASRKRLSVLITTRPNNPAGQSNSSATAAMDQGAEITEDLAPRVAANLERLRANENAAIDRLDSCVEAYEAVRQKVNQE